MSIFTRFDEKVSALVRGLPDSFRPFMAGLTFIGDPLIVTTVGFAGFLSAVLREQNAVAWAFVYSVIAFVINTLLKLVLHRRRPYGRIIKTLGFQSYSFPSGHAFGTVIFYGQFATLDLHYLTHPTNLILAAFLWTIIFLIGLSRVYLGAHYPSDVVAGWVLGGLSLIVINAIAY